MKRILFTLSLLLFGLNATAQYTLDSVGVINDSFRQMLLTSGQFFARQYGQPNNVVAYSIPNGVNATHWETYTHTQGVNSIAYVPFASIPEDPHHYLFIGGDGYMGMVDFHPLGDSVSLIGTQSITGSVLHSTSNGNYLFTLEEENFAYFLKRYSLMGGSLFLYVDEVSLGPSIGPLYLDTDGGNTVFVGMDGFAGTTLMAYDASQPDTLMFANSFSLFTGASMARNGELYVAANDNLLRYDVTDIYNPVLLDSAFTQIPMSEICIPEAGTVVGGNYITATAVWMQGNGVFSADTFQGDNYYLSIAAGPTGHAYYSNTSRTTILSPGLPASQEDRPELARFTAYPNPATDWVTLAFADVQPGTAQIHNLQGQRLLTAELPAERTARLSLSDLTPGLYLLTVERGGQRHTERLIVQ